MGAAAASRRRLAAMATRAEALRGTPPTRRRACAGRTDRRERLWPPASGQQPRASGKDGTEPVPPEPHGFMANIDATLEQNEERS